MPPKEAWRGFEPVYRRNPPLPSVPQQGHRAEWGTGGDFRGPASGVAHAQLILLRQQAAQIQAVQGQRQQLHGQSPQAVQLQQGQQAQGQQLKAQQLQVVQLQGQPLQGQSNWQQQAAWPGLPQLPAPAVVDSEGASGGDVDDR